MMMTRMVCVCVCDTLHLISKRVGHRHIGTTVGRGLQCDIHGNQVVMVTSLRLVCGDEWVV